VRAHRPALHRASVLGTSAQTVCIAVLELSFLRGITSAAAMAVLLYGLIWRTE
jgi:hypothetical protein